MKKVLLPWGQARVGPDQWPNCLQRASADKTSRIRVNVCLYANNVSTKVSWAGAFV